MTRIAIITDAHANLPALQAALQAIRQAGYDLLYHTGDVIGIGPHPQETLDLLLETPHAHLLMGNHELRYLNGMPAEQPETVPDLEFRHVRWVQRILGSGYRTVVRTFLRRIERTVHGRQICFLHYAPGSGRWNLHPVIKSPTTAQLDTMFAGCEADLVFYGHHHPPADAVGRARYINPGTLGCSADGLARYVMLYIAEDGTMQLKKHAVPYDRERVLRDLNRRRVPGREFIARTFFKATLEPSPPRP